MAGRVQTVDIIRSLVALMGVTVLITSITDNGDGTYTIETSNTYHLQATFTITIGGEDYTIVSVVRNTSFIISGTVLPTASSFNLAAPSYFHGTLIQATAEILKEDIKTITPMVYCLEELVDTEQPGDSSLDRKSDITLYFITQANFNDFLTADYLNNCHYQMRALADRFIEVCKLSSLVGKLNTGQDLKYTNINKLKIQINNGQGKNLFDKDLSGVRLQIPEFPITKIGCQRVVSLNAGVTITNSDGSLSESARCGTTFTLDDINISDSFGNDLGMFPAAVDAVIVSAIGLDVDFSADDVTAELGVPITFTPTIVGGVATIWHWDFGDGTLSHDEIPSKTYTAVGTYTVKLLASNSIKSGIQIKTAYITVTDTIAPSGYSIAFGADTYTTDINAVSLIAAGCEVGATYYYSISSSGGGTPVTGNGTVSSAGFTISGINCSGLTAGTLTVTFYLKDASLNQGSNVTDTAIYLDYDDDAQTFFTNAGITDSTIKGAISNYFIARKLIDPLSNSIASYPLVGGSASFHKWNAYNPLDTDAAKRLTFAGGITHDANGMQGNGTNGVANTYIIPANDYVRDYCIFYYTRSTSMIAGGSDFGAIAGGANPGLYGAVRPGVGVVISANSDLFARGNTISNGRGFVLIKRVGNTVTIKLNDVVKDTFTVSNTVLSPYELRLMAYMLSGTTVGGYGDKQYTHMEFLKTATTDQQDTDLYNAVLAKETALGRN